MAIKRFGESVIPQLLNSDGTVALSGRVDFLETGTSTPKDVFTDSDLAASAGNSINLDAAGRLDVWMEGPYRVRFFDTNGVQQWQIDDVNLDPVAASTQQSLIPGGSFENDANGDGIPDSWVAVIHAGATVARDLTKNRHGGAAMRFVSVGNGGGHITSENFFEVNPGRTITVTFSIESTVVDVRNLVEMFWFKADKTASATPTTSLYDDSTTNPTSFAEFTASVLPPTDAKFAKLRMHGAHESDSTTGTTWYDDVTVAVVGTAATQYDLIGLNLTANVASNALTVTDTTPAKIGFRNATLATGTFVTITTIAGLNIVVPAGATLGFINDETGFVYVYALNNAGVAELAVAKKALFDEATTHTTTLLDATSDSPNVLYSATARTNVAVRLIGRMKVQTGATAGDWDNAPTVLTVWAPAMKKTGDIIQVLIDQDSETATGVSAVFLNDSIPQNTEGDEFLSQIITPTDAENDLDIDVLVQGASSVTGTAFILQLHQDAIADALKAGTVRFHISNQMESCTLFHRMKAGTTSPTTLKIRAGTTSGTFRFNGNAAIRIFGGVSASHLRVQEVQA